ncbi:MAG: hypothetical protein NT007_02045 [Candidatus Kapabacteria bacterium]|nr:hypothetical protein [Candidatus Kapabacteria bacterium]
MQIALIIATGTASRCTMYYANLCKRLHFFIINYANYANQHYDQTIIPVQIKKGQKTMQKYANSINNRY